MRRHFSSFNLPLAMLLALLQRTPVVKAIAAAADYVIAAPAGQLLRAAFTAAALGALHGRAGATTFAGPVGPVRGRVGVPIDAVAFTYVGTPSSPARFEVSGLLPPGLSFQPAPRGSTILSGTPAVTGTPTQAGTFIIFVQGFNAEGLTNNIQQQIVFEIEASVSAVAPEITTHPQSQTVAPGATVTFSVQATGSPAPQFQWTRNSANIIGATTASLTLPNVQASDAGTYAVVVRNAAGTRNSNPASLTVVIPDGGGGAPVISSQPGGGVVVAGSTVAFNVAAAAATSFQWQLNGNNIPGATRSTLVVPRVSTAGAGAYTVLASNAAGPALSNPAVLTVSNGTDFGRLINLSILTDITAADPLFTLGTVIGGAGTAGAKPLLIRAAGPSLAQLGVTGALPDPRLQIFSGQAVIAENDNWSGSAALSAAFRQVGAFNYDSAASLDAATFNAQTPAGAYTIQVTGAAPGTGTVIAELYDASASSSVTASTPRLVNVSVLKQVPTGSILTAGFVISGGSGASKTVLIRAVGPTLGAPPFNVSGAMPDPKLELFRGSAVIAANDNWGGDAQLTAVGNSVGAFAIGDPASRDAVLVVTLAPGNYTAQVSGVGNGGAVIVEVYEVL